MANMTRVAGQPDYYSTGSAFIPEIWSGKLLVKFYDATCLDQITNNDYEGEIKGAGSKVIIRTTPDTTIRDYQIGQKLTIERPESDPVELYINKGKYYNFVIDDVLKYQSNIKLLDDWSQDAGEQMKIKVETDVFADVYASTHASNCGITAGVDTAGFNLGVLNSPVQLTKTNIIDYIVDCGTVLDEQNVPETGRWMVIPAWVRGLIMKSDIKDASLMGDGSSILRNGRIGMVDRFTLYSSNNLATIAAATDTSGFKGYYALFGTNDAISFASQFVNTESLRGESAFGDIVRGLKVFGYEVTKPEALGTLYCRK